MGLEKTFENITGTLQNAYKQTEFGTGLHAAQLIEEIAANEKFQDKLFYPLDGFVYFTDRLAPRLMITGEIVNSVLRNIDDAVKQLGVKKNYSVNQYDFCAARSASDSVVIDMRKLKNLTTINTELPYPFHEDKEFCYLTFNTAKPLSKYTEKYTEEEQKVFFTLIGLTPENYDYKIEKLRASPGKINEIKIKLLKPSYVLMSALNKPIARFSSLCKNSDDAAILLDAGDRNVDYKYGCIRGKRIASPEACSEK